MTYLDLVNKLKDKCGIAGPKILDVKAETPQINKLLCDWIREAWIAIQTNPELSPHLLYKDNNIFRVKEQLTYYEYTNEDFQLSDEIRFDFNQVQYKQDKTESKFQYLTKRGINEIDIRVEPEEYVNCIVPTTPKSFYLVPTNSIDGFLRINYWDTPQTLTENNDVIEDLPDHLQLVIVFKAMIEYSIYDAAPELLGYGTENYREYMRRLYHLYNVNTNPKTIRFNKF